MDNPRFPRKFYQRKLFKWAVRLLLLLLLFKTASAVLYRLHIQDEFYASAVPGDPVHMGMSPRDVRLALGKPDDTYVEEDAEQVGLAGNHFEMQPTGQVFLYYWRPMLGQNARLSYSYYKGTGRVENLTVNVGDFTTLSEAQAVAEEAAAYAHTAFARKGEYTCTPLGAGAYWFQAKKDNRVFNLEVIVQDHTRLNIFAEPYAVKLYQSLW